MMLTIFLITCLSPGFIVASPLPKVVAAPAAPGLSRFKPAIISRSPPSIATPTHSAAKHVEHTDPPTSSSPAGTPTHLSTKPVDITWKTTPATMPDLYTGNPESQRGSDWEKHICSAMKREGCSFEAIEIDQVDHPHGLGKIVEVSGTPNWRGSRRVQINRFGGLRRMPPEDLRGKMEEWLWWHTKGD